MGLASSMGLGLAVSLPKEKVTVLDGDGSVLMNLGSLATVAGMGPKNMFHFVFNNGIYAITGGQPVPAPGVKYAEVAKACGYSASYRFEDTETFDNTLPKILQSEGPVLIELVVKGEPQTDGVDQTWESNAGMPRQLRALRKRLTGKDDWGTGGPYI